MYELPIPKHVKEVKNDGFIDYVRLSKVENMHGIIGMGDSDECEDCLEGSDLW